MSYWYFVLMLIAHCTEHCTQNLHDRRIAKWLCSISLYRYSQNQMHNHAKTIQCWAFGVSASTIVTQIILGRIKNNIKSHSIEDQFSCRKCMGNKRGTFSVKTDNSQNGWEKTLQLLLLLWTKNKPLIVLIVASCSGFYTK